MYRSLYIFKYLCIFGYRLNTLIECLCKKFKSIIIAGDLKIIVLRGNTDHFELKKLLKNNGVSYYVNLPIRICQNSQSVINNVFTNSSGNEIQVEGVVTILSDHDGQLQLI